MQLFDYKTITENLSVGDAIGPVEEAFKKLANGEVDVPFPVTAVDIECDDSKGDLPET